MGSGFVKMIRSAEADELRKDPNAFTLLSLIANRARREPGVEVHNGITVYLEAGEAMIGDYKSCGLSESTYKTSKKKLVRMGQITANGNTKGTIAKLINSNIFDINLDDSLMYKEGRTERHQNSEQNANGVATNKN